MIKLIEGNVYHIHKVLVEFHVGITTSHKWASSLSGSPPDKTERNTDFVEQIKIEKICCQ